MHAERILPIQEFSGVEITNPFEEELVERLKEPTRRAAKWYQLMVEPPMWYSRIYKGGFDDRVNLEKFKTEFNRRSASDSELKSPYTFIDENWRPRSFASVRAVNRLLKEDICKFLMPIAEWLRESPLQKSYSEFADFIENTAVLLPEGRFDELMVEFLRLPTAQRVNWMINLVEYLDDPLGVKASPEGFLAYTDKKRTFQANTNIALYERAAKEKYGISLIPVKAFVSYMIMCSGLLGVGDRRISAFNIPNDPKVSEKAGNAIIGLFPDRISKKNQSKLAPALEGLCGIKSSDQDAETFALAHEEAHGLRFEGETQRLGPQRSVVREGLANRLGVGLAASGRFTDEHVRQVVYGHLAYASDDIGTKLGRLVTEPLGRNQPTLDEILQESGPYGVDAYLLARISFLRRFIRHPMRAVNVDGIVRLAEEMVPIYIELAKAGTEEVVRKALGEFIDKRKMFPLPGVLKEILSKIGVASSLFVS